MPDCIHIPRFPLSDHISYMWYCCSDDIKQDVISLPIPSVEMVLNFGESYRITGNDNSIVINNNRHWLSGLQSQPTVTSLRGRHECLGIVFKSTGVLAFTTIPLSDLGDRPTELTSVWGREAETLYEALHETVKVIDKFMLAEHFLLKRLRPEYAVNHHLAKAIRSFERHPSGIQMKDLYSAAGISKKSLTHLFRRYIGMPPGRYRRLLVFNQTLTAIRMQAGSRLTDVAYDHDYFDQSHFIKEFSSFAGCTPKQYQQHCRQHRITPGYENYIDAAG